MSFNGVHRITRGPLRDIICGLSDQQRMPGVCSFFRRLVNKEMVELLSTLTLATPPTRRGLDSVTSEVWNVVRRDRYWDCAAETDRLTQEEAGTTTAQTLELVNNVNKDTDVELTEVPAIIRQMTDSGGVSCEGHPKPETSWHPSHPEFGTAQPRAGLPKATFMRSKKKQVDLRKTVLFVPACPFCDRSDRVLRAKELPWRSICHGPRAKLTTCF
ncbi:hypothetical protein EDB86DRAFT_750752 [Lactarius hatsudake]|nr:hypothetical protein EDB86DRAFT_750752 [Lactarius hatsudake]